jgi:hypothetical protein
MANGDDLLGDDDLLGLDSDLLGDLDELGLRLPNPFRRKKKNRPALRTPVGRALAAAQNRAVTQQAFAQGLPSQQGSKAFGQFLPFPTGTFAAGVGALTLPARPQRNIIIERLVIALGRNGSTATGLVTVTNFTIGVDPQFAQTGSIPADIFSPTAVGTMFKANTAEKGIDVTLQLAISPVPTTSDTVIVSAAALGPTLA